MYIVPIFIVRASFLHSCSPEQAPQLLQPPLTILTLVPLPRHRQIGKRLLLILEGEHLLLEALVHDVPLNRDLSVLAEPVHAINSLSFGSRVKLRLHHEDLVGGGQVETEAARPDGDEHYTNGRVRAESIH
jgi:hypothetical protein